MYNKLFGKILNSSVWLEEAETRLVWLTCIAAMDEDGFVQCASPANMAHLARVSLEGATVALDRLEAEDPNSSNPANGGRRLERVPGGWLVLNHKEHRDLVTRAVAREQTRIRVARHREKKRLSVTSNGGNGQKRKRSGPVMQSEAISEADPEKQESPNGDAPPKAPPDPRVKEFLTWFQDEYKRRRHGAVFLVRWAKDAATVKQLLTAADLERLKLYAGILLSEKTDDPFIVDSDRGIGVLAARFNWLADRLAAWEARHARQA